MLHRFVQNEKPIYIRIILEIYDQRLYDTKYKDYFVIWINKRNSQSFLALEIAAQRSNVEIINLIYSYYEKYNSVVKFQNKETNIFHQISKKNEMYPLIFFYEKLQKHYPNENILDFTNNTGMTPLHYAAKCNNKRVLDLLLDYGCNINQIDDDGYTALHYAVTICKYRNH